MEKKEDNLPKQYLTYPKPGQSAVTIRKAFHIFCGSILFSFYWVLACFTRTPGLGFRSHCAWMGMRFLLKGDHFRRAYGLIVSPMDSVRYFEFDFMWHAIKNVKVRSYLDVSSPRTFALIVVDRNPNLVADLINPDKKDLATTISWAKELSLADRCRFHSDRIETAQLEPNSFDVITTISVIEHIPDDQRAIRKMWDLVRPGGLLLISVPCAAKASEEYINLNEYELLNPDENGYVFWQRYYDEELIRERIFSVTGQPHKLHVYGEKIAGTYNNISTEKRTDPFYPYWREPLMMGLTFEFKKRISDLPGVGVAAMEFVKPV